ncbi:MAG: transglycosylase domain-containing protein [Hydrogenophilaceae bacterium]
MRRRNWFWLTFGLVLFGLAGVAAYELIASPFQAMLLADYAKRLTYRTESGPSDLIRYPTAGPSDIRFGYTGLPEFLKRLEQRGYQVSQQARLSPEMDKLADYGLYLPYREKSSAGLTLDDCAGNPYYSFRQPRRTYADFAAIPPVVANTLLFIENRELLDPNHPQRNPAVEWDRLAQAVLEKMVQVVQPGRNVPGGSTLATQIEKFRHSPDGLTLTPGDKLRQMASASVRAYLDGSDTRVTRRRIVLDYLNTVPLSAAPGFGEVNGLGDALQAWFGYDFDRVNLLLKNPDPTAEAARAYKHVLGLLISQRKPSWYLLSGRKQLDAQADAHLGLLAEAGVITPAFRDLARKQHIAFHDGKTVNYRPNKVNKAAGSARNELAALLGVDRLYDLDRLDLTVATTLHGSSQEQVAGFLRSLTDPAAVKAAGLMGDHLLSPGNDLTKVLYSFTLQELTEDGAVLRVQADNLDQPFDINRGAKLDMGSSAKLRTLITYLQLIAELHGQYRVYSARDLDKLQIPEKDVLTRWAVDWLRDTSDRSLDAMLQAAMERTYSASPAEAFYTGGGLHTFVNFKKEDNGRVVDLWEALRNSINLPFIRLMRDIARHFTYRAPSTAARVLADAEDPERQTYLTQFADKEGRTFLARFWKKYRGLDSGKINDILLNHLAAHPVRLAAVYRYMEPQADPAAFKAFMKSRLVNPDAWDDAELQKLYENYGPDRYNLADRAYITQIHPLELWLVAYLRQHPGARWDALVEASAKERIAGYDWLFKTGRKNAQDIRIQSLLEIEAFQEIHQRWRRLGYPFASLVPSYASAIGSSADRPAALAELIGIVLNDGVKLSPVTLKRLDFAAGTPYHTVFASRAPASERVIPAEVARVVRQAMINVVEQGTARRVAGAFTTQQGKLAIGGKTGTGDQRFDTYAPNGAVLESRVVNRVATFAFFIGRHFYGVVTAYVPGAQAANYKFTSALPVQLLKSMAPILRPLVASSESRQREWADEVAAFLAENPPAPPPSLPPAPPADEAKPAPGEAAGEPKPALEPGHPLVKPQPAPAKPPAEPSVPGIEPESEGTVREEPVKAEPKPAKEHKPPPPPNQPGRGFEFN